MPSRALREEANYIARDELLETVSLSVLRDSKAGLPLVEDWSKGAITKQPLRIYDINGKLLFCDYTVKRGRNTLGTVRAGASKVLGDPIVSHEIGPRHWDYRAAVRKLTPMVRKVKARLGGYLVTLKKAIQPGSAGG